MASALTQSFWPIFVGSLMLAATAPFGFNSISLIANVWFGDSQRATATSIMGLSDIIGALATFVIQGILSYFGYFNSQSDPSLLRQQTYIVMISEGAATILIAILFIIVMREKPARPPSRIAETVGQEMRLGMWKDVAHLLKNRNFMCLLVSYSIVYSVINSMMDAISPIFHNYYDNESFISTIAIIQILTSVVTELLSGFWLDKTKRYLCTLRTTVIASTVVIGMLIFIVPSGNYALCAFGIGISGFAIGPIMPVGFDFGI
jgi:Na+/melibiose symporter-like transporter